ncbi:MAG: glycosyltransferase family 4 protein [Chlorobi bacterium]|nr:glycosyltransferase family 4 protein [Chlorobiota bacterium]
MTEIFFIAYQFPPLNVGGSFRPLKFVKYFNDFEIKPVIFTLNPDDYHKIYKQKKPDFNLLKEIESVDKEIIHVKTEDLSAKRKNIFRKFFQIYFSLTKGSEHKNWEKHFFEAAEKALKKYSPKVILVTAPPFGIVELAVKLSKQTGIPLIIDMRDSLSMWVSQPYGSFFHYKLTLKKEKHWFKYAKKVIAVTNQMVNDWKSVHKNIPDSRYKVIPNGFDVNLSFNKLQIIPNPNKLIIGYVGSFYYNPESRNMMYTPWYKKRLHRKLQYVPRKEDWLYRSPYFFFKTLSCLFKKNPDYKNKIYIKFVGAKPAWFDKMVEEFSLTENIFHLGFISQDKSVEFQKQCDMLLITSAKVEEGKDYCIAGKTFDYIASKKPILGFVTEGEQKDFIEKSGTGIICNPDNIESSAEKLKNVFENGITLKPNKNFIEQYHRKNLTKKISEIIFSI